VVPVEILNIDLDKKRIGVAVVPEGSARAAAVSASEITPDDTESLNPPTDTGFGSLADKLRGALGRQPK
jgi:hypothetical protein